MMASPSPPRSPSVRATCTGGGVPWFPLIRVVIQSGYPACGMSRSQIGNRLAVRDNGAAQITDACIISGSTPSIPRSRRRRAIWGSVMMLPNWRGARAIAAKAARPSLAVARCGRGSGRIPKAVPWVDLVIYNEHFHVGRVQYVI
jgi:hypothetical protein